MFHDGSSFLSTVDDDDDDWIQKDSLNEMEYFIYQMYCLLRFLVSPPLSIYLFSCLFLPIHPCNNIITK